MIKHDLDMQLFYWFKSAVQYGLRIKVTKTLSS